MPYKIRKKGSQWCVVKKTTGESVGCSDSEEKAKAHLAALYANVKDAMRNYAFKALSVGDVRTEKANGREYLVAPVVAMIGDSVVHAMNARSPELVPASELAKMDFDDWVDRPIFNGHPTHNGIPVSGIHPKVSGSAIGFTKKPSFVDNKFTLEAWVDTALADEELLTLMRANVPVDVSVGAFVNTESASGESGGKAYTGIWRNLEADHLALLPNAVGACSWEMGCGIRAAMEAGNDEEIKTAWADKDGTDDHGRSKEGHGGSRTPKAGDSVKVMTGQHSGKSGKVTSSDSQGSFHFVEDAKGNSLGSYHSSDLKTKRSAEMRDAWLDPKTGIDDHGRAASEHEAAASAHTTAAAAHYSAAHPELHSSDHLGQQGGKEGLKLQAAKMTARASSASKDAPTGHRTVNANAANKAAGKASQQGKHETAFQQHQIAAQEHTAMAKMYRGASATEYRAAWPDKGGIDNHGRAMDANLKSQTAHTMAAEAHEAAHMAQSNLANLEPNDEQSGAELQRMGTNATAAASNATEYATQKSAALGMGHSSHVKGADAASSQAEMHAMRGDHEAAAAAHKSAAEYHRDAAANHGRQKLHATEANVKALHCYAAWLEPGPETDELLKTLRDIPQASRDKMDKADFAGPNESFPIQKPVDVENAARAIGRAKGNRASIKARIIAIAYRKGFEGSLPDDWKRKTDTKAASGFLAMMQDAWKKIRPAQSPDAMTDSTLRTKLREAIEEMGETNIMIEDVYPVSDPAHVVYSCWEPAQEGAEYPGSWCCYERPFELADSGVVSVGDLKTEVARVISYEPVEGAEPRALKAACGCENRGQEEAMTKQERVKALIAASNGLFIEADSKMLESASDEQLARYEGQVAGIKTAAEKQAADLKAANDAKAAAEAAANKTVTFADVLATAPADVQATIKAAQVASANRKAATIKALKDSKRCSFTDEQLQAFPQDQLDNLVTLAGITPAAPAVDHSLAMPPSGAAAVEGGATFVAAADQDKQNEKVKAAFDKKQNAKK